MLARNSRCTSQRPSGIPLSGLAAICVPCTQALAQGQLTSPKSPITSRSDLILASCHCRLRSGGGRSLKPCCPMPGHGSWSRPPSGARGPRVNAVEVLSMEPAVKRPNAASLVNVAALLWTGAHGVSWIVTRFLSRANDSAANLMALVAGSATSTVNVNPADALMARDVRPPWPVNCAEPTSGVGSRIETVRRWADRRHRDAAHAAAHRPRVRTGPRLSRLLCGQPSQFRNCAWCAAPTGRAISRGVSRGRRRAPVWNARKPARPDECHSSATPGNWPNQI